MVIKINKKPIQVKENDRKPVDKLYLTISGLGTFTILWVMDSLARQMVGSSPFPFTHIIDWIISIVNLVISCF